MRLHVPYTGAVIEVADKAAERYIARGYKPVQVAKPKGEAKPVEKAAPKKTRAKKN